MFDILEGKPAVESVCDNKEAFLYMPEREDSRYGKRLSSSLITAVPKSAILKEAFDVLTGIMTSGNVPYEEELRLLKWNEDTNVHFIENSL